MRPKQFPSLWYVRRNPCTDLASRLALSSNGPKRASVELRHLGVPSGVSNTISEPMVHLTKPCTYLALTLTTSPNGPNKISHDARHLGVPSGASKTISEPMVRLAQTVHISYINTNTDMNPLGFMDDLSMRGVR